MSATFKELTCGETDRRSEFFCPRTFNKDMTIYIPLVEESRGWAIELPKVWRARQESDRCESTAPSRRHHRMPMALSEQLIEESFRPINKHEGRNTKHKQNNWFSPDQNKTKTYTEKGRLICRKKTHHGMPDSKDGYLRMLFSHQLNVIQDVRDVFFNGFDVNAVPIAHSMSNCVIEKNPLLQHGTIEEGEKSRLCPVKPCK